ncbi:MAG: hypothetical protein IKD47_02080 [Clostridia bacterium]|nr:hypothetical protein [Clostridia bacterium]
MDIQKIKNYSTLSTMLKIRIRKLTLGKIGVEKTQDGAKKKKMFEFYTHPRAFRGTYGFYCLCTFNEEGFLAWSFIYRGKKKWYDVLKMLIPSKRRELKYEIDSGIRVSSITTAQKQCKEYNALGKQLEADVNPESGTVYLSFYKYVTNKQELDDVISSALECLQDEATKNFIKGLGV